MPNQPDVRVTYPLPGYQTIIGGISNGKCKF
ncbi:CRISPR-associated protein Cas5 [Planomicrobium sp. CPCC 101079]